MNKLAFDELKLAKLFGDNQGDANTRIAIIDGAVDASHADFSHTPMLSIGDNEQPVCQVPGSPSCQHGTFVAGILAADRQSQAPGICPQSTLMVKPIFCEADQLSDCPMVTETNLAGAINRSIDAGADIINMSVGLIGPQNTLSDELAGAYDRAKENDVLLVAASGNQGSSEVNSIFKHPWVIPVAAMDEQGAIVPSSNGGDWVAEHGLLAPGKAVVSTKAGGGYQQMTGSSVAAPFVTGVLALMKSQYPQATAEQLRSAILQQGEPMMPMADNGAVLPQNQEAKPSKPPKPLSAELSLSALESLLNRHSDINEQTQATPQTTQATPQTTQATPQTTQTTPQLVSQTKPQATPQRMSQKITSEQETITMNTQTVAAQPAPQPAPQTLAPQAIVPEVADHPVVGEQGIQPQGNCETCNFTASNPPEYIYASGRLRPHFTSLGLEKESDAIAKMLNISPRDHHALFTYKDEDGDLPYRYLAEQVSWILSIDNQDVYVLLPNTDVELDQFIDTLAVDEGGNLADEKQCVAIGVLGPEAPKELSGDKPLKMVMCNHLFDFTTSGLVAELDVNKSTTTTAIKDVLNGLTVKPNVGASNEGRAKNFLAYRYSSIFSATSGIAAAANGAAKPAEDAGADESQFLASLDAKPSNGTPGRTIIDIIFTYQKNVSGRQRAYYASVDVTDQFPFLHSNLSDYVPAS